jgi:hypothetical protein
MGVVRMPAMIMAEKVRKDWIIEKPPEARESSRILDTPSSGGV